MPVPEPEWPSLIPAASVEAQRAAVAAVRQAPVANAALAPVQKGPGGLARKSNKALPVALAVGVVALVVLLVWLL